MRRPTIILASSSEARKSLLSRLQIPFTVVSPDVDETPLPNEQAEALVKRLAVLKAETVAMTHPHALVIGADQVGCVGDVILGKPLTEEEAFKTLQFISGKHVRFYTGMCVLRVEPPCRDVLVDTYDVYFRQLSDDAIRRYLSREKPLHCAGSFHVEGLGISLIDRLAGDDYTALIGLPLTKLTKIFLKEGVA